MTVFDINNKIEYCKAYSHFSAAKCFIIGGIIGDNVYVCFINENQLFANFLDNIQSVDTSSKNRKCKAFRIAFSTNLKKYVKENGFIICNKADFETKAKELGNKGYTLEYMIYKYYNRADEWKKDNANFTEKGDITINGIEYQIKGHRGNLSNELTLKELLATA